MSRLYAPILRNVIYPIIQLKEGRPTYKHLRHLRQCGKLSCEELRSLQWRKIKSTLRLSERIKLYREKYSESGILIDDIDSWNDFQKLPLLTKDEVREAQDDLLAETYAGPLVKVRTGGSTGQPLVYEWGPRTIAANLAAAWRSRRWHGISIGDPYIHVWGHYRFLDPEGGKITKLVKQFEDKLMNRLWLSAYNMSEADIASYIKRVKSFKPVWGIGYASAFYRLATYCEKHAVSWPFSMRGIVLTSENCYSFQRELIEGVFECPTIVEYGATEVGIIAYECSHGQLHIADENVYVEVIPREGLPSGTGEIVITQLHNPATPLIRYRTGDIGSISDESCSCGRNLTVLDDLVGRQIDMLVTPDGRYVHGLYVIHIFDYLENVDEFQLVQTTRKSFDVFVVRENPNTPINTAFLLQRMQEQFGEEVEVSIKYVDHLASEPSGKLCYIRSRVSADSE